MEEPQPLTRSQLLKVSQSIGGNGPTWRRIESAHPEVVPMWGTLADFGGRYFFLEGLHEGLPPTPAGNFSTEGDTIDWLIRAINEHLPEVCEAIRERLRAAAAESVEKAREREAEATRQRLLAEKRVRDSEVQGV